MLLISPLIRYATCLGLLLCLVSVPTSAAATTAQSIRQAAESHARSMAVRKGLLDVKVEAQRLDSRLRLKPCSQALNTQATGKRMGGRITVSVRCTDTPGWSLYVPVKIEAAVNAVTVQKSLPRGTVLARGDLMISRMSLAAASGDYLSDPADAVGKALRRPLRAGSMLYLRSLETPHAVERGQATELVSTISGVQVKVQGVALGSGAPGEWVRVRNKTSGKTVEGVVTPEGWVRIP